jgi:hypothetical protein
MSTKRKYGLKNFAFDVIATLLTGGIWIIWILIREDPRKK